MSQSETLNECLCCGSARLAKYLDLGKQPLANSFMETHVESANLPRFDLSVNVCLDCWHSQLTEAVDPSAMYRNYLWVTGTSKVSQEYYRDLVSYILLNTGRINPRVLDIASNDGTLLQAFMDRGCEALGVDPAVNVVEISRSRGHKVISDFWTDALAENLLPFDVITACNVVAHGANPYRFISNCRRALRSAGTLFVQTSHVDFLRKLEFETVYHEHHSFFNTRSMAALAERAGMSLRKTVFRPLDGRSYLFHLTSGKSTFQDFGEVRQFEESAGTFNGSTYEQYQPRVNEVIQNLKHILESGMPTILYGAPARATVLINACNYGLGNTPIRFAIDDNPLKHGRYIPGTAIQIHPIEKLRELEKPTVVVMAWNFIDSIRPRIFEVCPKAKVVTYL